MSLISSAALHKSITYLPAWLRDEKAQRKVHLSTGTDNEKIMDWLANKKLFKTSFDQQLIPCNEKIFQKNIIELTYSAYPQYQQHSARFPQHDPHLDEPKAPRETQWLPGLPQPVYDSRNQQTA